MYEQLKALLGAIDGIQFAEYEWATRPAGNHGTYQLEFQVDSDIGDDGHIDQAEEGSVDIWYKNLEEVDQETRMLRREYVFQMEAV